MRGHLRPAAGVLAEWSHKPLVLYDKDGNETAAIVKNQLFVHFGGSINILDTLRISLDLPLAALNSGDEGSVDAADKSVLTYPAPNGRPLGDLRLSAAYRLFGTY